MSLHPCGASEVERTTLLAHQDRATAAKRDRRGGKEPQELLYLLLVGRAVLGTQQMLNESSLRFPGKQSGPRGWVPLTLPQLLTAYYL